MDRSDFSVLGYWLDPKWVLIWVGSIAALVGAWAFGVVRDLAASAIAAALVVWGFIWILIASYQPPRRPWKWWVPRRADGLEAGDDLDLQHDRRGFANLITVAGVLVLAVVFVFVILMASGVIPNPQAAGQTKVYGCQVGVRVTRYNSMGGALPVSGVVVNITFPGKGVLPMNGSNGPLSGTTDSSGAFIVSAYSCTQGVQVAFTLTTGPFTSPQTTPNTTTTLGLLQASGDIFSPTVV